MPRRGCALLWGQCSLFRYLYVRSIRSAATCPKNARKGDGSTCFGSFLGLGSTSDVGICFVSLESRIHGSRQKEPAEAAAALEASARAEVRRRSTRPHTRATPSAWTCFSRPAPRRRAPPPLRVASLRSFKGQEDVERCRKPGFPGVPRRIPSLGTQNRSFTDSIQWPLSICLATSSWAVVHFIV